MPDLHQTSTKMSRIQFWILWYATLYSDIFTLVSSWGSKVTGVMTFRNVQLSDNLVNCGPIWMKLALKFRGFLPHSRYAIQNVKMWIIWFTVIWCVIWHQLHDRAGESELWLLGQVSQETRQVVGSEGCFALFSISYPSRHWPFRPQFLDSW